MVRVIIAAALLGSAHAAAPPDDADTTEFLRRQGEMAATEHFVTVDPNIRFVACALPQEDAPGVQFLCYAISPDDRVHIAWARLNDDGGIDVTPATGANAPPPPTTAPPNPNIGSYSGTGNQTVQVDPINGPTVISVVHDGAGPFSVQPQQGGVPVGTQVFSVTGRWEGRYLVGLGGTISAFAITADGVWTLTVQRRTAATPLDPGSGASGSGPDVLAFNATEQQVWAATADRQLRVTAITAAGPAVIVDGPAPLSGEMTVPAGPGFLTIGTAGPWSIKPPAATGPPTTSSP